MKNKLNVIISAVSLVTLFSAAVALPASALSVGANLSASAASGTVSVTAQARLAAAISKITARADQEITRRINALDALNNRVNAMAKLSATEKTSLAANIQTQLTAMTTLQAQIATDAAANNTSSLKTDVKSITSSYRIFALIIPQGAIEAASDRILSIQGIMLDLGTKLSARLTTVENNGNNVGTAAAAMTDFNAKVADSAVQANAAASEVSSLAPDNGNATIMASNTAALKDARAKILAGQKDLVAARADAQVIVKALAKFNGSTTVTASTSASAR